MALTASSKLALKRGALITTANWQVVVLQFVADALFSALLGAAAGDLALTVGARGGIYVAGGVCMRLGPLFDRAAFRRRFVDKGRMGKYLEPIPTWLVLRGDTGLIGAAHHRLDD